MMGRRVVVIWRVTNKKIRHQTVKWPVLVIPRAYPERKTRDSPKLAHINQSMISRSPRKVAEVLETLKSQTTGANPTSRSPDSAISVQSIPDTVENLASRPPIQVNI